MEMGRAQDMVEVTQKKILARFSLCSSPSFSSGKVASVILQGLMLGARSSSTRSHPVSFQKFQGQSDGRPYYRSDIEGRSLPSPTLPTSSSRRNKRSAFIGRVDGGGTTTTRRPWNYGAHGGGSGAWSSRAPWPRTGRAAWPGDPRGPPRSWLAWAGRARLSYRSDHHPATWKGYSPKPESG